MKKILALIVILFIGVFLAACIDETDDNGYAIIDAKISTIIEQLNIPNTTADHLVLPTTHDEHPLAVISWHSSNTAAILTDGQVFRASEDQTVTLTVIVQLEGRSQSKQFVVNVLKYVPSTVTVTFVIEDSVSIDAEIQIVEIGDTIKVPVATRPGYTLIAWYSDIDLTNEWLFDINVVIVDMMLFPKWELIVITPSGFMMGAGEYYESAANLIGNELKMELRDILTTTFHGVTYGDARAVLARSDRNYQAEYKTVRGIYNNTVMTPFWQPSTAGGVWQREHVWPQSKLGATAANNRANIASDLHNLRAIDGVNQTRGNRYFTDPINPDADTSVYSLVGTTAFFPGDEHKGDVARILLYMIVKWPQLTLSNDPAQAANTSALTMGLLDVLLRWHREDPPCRFERERNEFIYSHEGPQNSFVQENEFRHVTSPAVTDFANIRPQGNRNPFIDIPELAYLIWEDYTIACIFPDLDPSGGGELVLVEYINMPNRIWYDI